MQSERRCRSSLSSQLSHAANTCNLEPKVKGHGRTYSKRGFAQLE